MTTPNEALRILEHSLEATAMMHEFTPTVRVEIEIKRGKATAKIASSVMFKKQGDDYRYASESVEGIDWHETLDELARRRGRHVAVFSKLIEAPSVIEPPTHAVDADEEIPF